MKLILIFAPIAVIILATILIHFLNKPKQIDPNNPNNKLSCVVSSDQKLLTPCNPNDVNSCSNCTQGIYSCITVDDENPHKTEQDGTEKSIPNGSWCLPPTKTDTFSCNKFSGYPVFSRVSANEFAWRCQCRFPTLITSGNIWSDCTYQTACGGDSNPLVCPNDASYCTPGTAWSAEPTYFPTNAVCKCGNGTKYIDNSDPSKNSWDKRCVTDTCVPGYSSDNGCKCPDKTQNSDGSWLSYIRCPQNVADDKKMQCEYNQCIQDPCNPNGYYDPSQLKCVCTAAGYINQQNEQSVIKNICYAPCDDQHNPCGDRGQCQLNSDGTTQCTNCVSPWKQDPTNKCNFHMKDLGEKCSNDSDCLSNYCVKKWAWDDYPVCTSL